MDAIGSVGLYTSMALDAQGNSHVSYYGATNSDLRYASAAIELTAPAPGTVWPVGASRSVVWDGTGQVELWLSVDAGRTRDPLGRKPTSGRSRRSPHADNPNDLLPAGRRETRRVDTRYRDVRRRTTPEPLRAPRVAIAAAHGHLVDKHEGQTLRHLPGRAIVGAVLEGGPAR